MKVCFCGLGSIGQRHFRNLLAIENELHVNVEFHALRKTAVDLEYEVKDRLVREVSDENYLDHDYDIVFVTNPTALHYQMIRIMANRTNHMFIEKPIFDDTKYRLSALHLQEGNIYYVAGPLRFSGVIQTLNKIISEEKVYCIRVICSSYLPDWRPGSDYRMQYSASRKNGGGVALDLIHEWDYITMLFGFPNKVYSLRGKYSDLAIDSDDAAIYIADFGDKIAELHLDYYGRTPRREIEIFTQTGMISGNLIDRTISFTDGREPIQFTEDQNTVYLNEMRYFIEHVLNNRSLNNLENCYSQLQIALGEELQ